MVSFLSLAERKNEGKYLLTYYKRFALVFAAISAALFLVFYFFSPEIMQLFGKDYGQNEELLVIFAFGLIGAMTMRAPLGNLLSAIGWAGTNFAFSLVILLINLVCSYYMVLKMGVEGAAWVTSGLMWLSGIFSLVAVLVYVRRVRNSK